jgi:hypothetical protein
VEHNKITFKWEGDLYEWLSSQPVVGGGGNWNVWVLHDSDYSPELFNLGVEPQSAETTTPKGSDLERMIKEMGVKRRAEFGIPSDSQNSSAPSPAGKRIRVAIGAADRMQNVLPRN